MTRKKLDEQAKAEAAFITGGDQQTPAPTTKATTTNTEDVLSQILQPAKKPPKAASIRFTADLPEALHRRLTLAAYKAGKKKVDIVREILEHVLPDEQ